MPLIFFFALPCLCPYPAFHVPCCALIFFRNYLLCTYFSSHLPAVPYLFYFHLPCCTLFPLFAYHSCCALLILFSLTLLYQFPAFRLPLTRLWPYLFYFHLPCCTHFPLFAYHLPCCALTYFTFTYPAVRFSRFSLTTYPVRRKIRAQQGKRKAQQGTEYGVSA